MEVITGRVRRLAGIARLVAGLVLALQSASLLAGGAAQPDVLDGTRAALLIANAHYQQNGWERVDRTVADATEIKAKLELAGFTPDRIVILTDPSREEFREGMKRFRAIAQEADVVLIYYAGHGFQYGSNNYLVPVDAPAEVEASEIEQTYWRVDDLIGVSGRNGGGRIILMDACRSVVPVILPEKNRSAAQPSAMGIFAAQRETNIIFSTAPGDRAWNFVDPDDQLSPFGAALVEHIVSPGIDFDEMFRRVRRSVSTATAPPKRNPGQFPQQQDGFTRRFYFVPGSEIQSLVTLPNGTPEATGDLTLDLSEATLATTDMRVLLGDVLGRLAPENVIALANNGDPVAQSLLGGMLQLGMGVGADQTEARRWYERSAQTHALGQFMLGRHLIDYSEKVDERKRGVALVRSASDAGFVRAQAYLAYLLDFGPRSIIKRNEEESIALTRSAADSGYEYSVFLLATIDGYDEALGRLRAIAETGNVEGHDYICQLTARFRQGAKGADSCQIAARAGYPRSQAYLAILYADGSGVEKSRDLARNWARLAQPALEAESGDDFITRDRLDRVRHLAR